MKKMLNEYVDCFLAFWCQESNEDFKPLEVKQCAVASDIPEFNGDDIINRLQKVSYSRV